MSFTVERTQETEDGSPVYSLLDAQGSTLLKAEQVPGLGPEDRQQIRLARPGGRLMATIDLPQVDVPGMEDDARTDYAVIHDFAVYAIVSACRRPDAEVGSNAYYVLEVEGEAWTALPDAEDATCYALYDDVPAGLDTYDTLTELDLPPCIGRVCRADEGRSLAITLSPQHLKHTDLVLLALGLLIDRAGALS